VIAEPTIVAHVFGGLIAAAAFKLKQDQSTAFRERLLTSVSRLGT
jgi:hypothetical protein